MPYETGLTFKSNNTTGSDIRIEWSGANLLPRTEHTAIWKINHVQQTGYYAVAWHTSNDGTFHASTYEYGTHPYPCDGTFEFDGRASNPTFSSGTVHYSEIAGLGSLDFISSPDPTQASYLVTKGIWYTQARTCRLITVSTTNDTMEHVFYPDINSPSNFIKQTILTSALATPTNPAFILGCSPWTVTGSTNSETPSGTVRGIQLYSSYLNISDIIAEVNKPKSTAAGASSYWYINVNPTPSDITDQSGAGHNPDWANSNRPSLYTGPFFSDGIKTKFLLPPTKKISIRGARL